MERIGGEEFAEELLKEQGTGDVADGIAKRYGVHPLVWYKAHATMEIAITRAKAIKGRKRAWKIGLIEKSNPDLRDLYEELTSLDPGFRRNDEAGVLRHLMLPPLRATRFRFALHFFGNCLKNSVLLPLGWGSRPEYQNCLGT